MPRRTSWRNGGGRAPPRSGWSCPAEIGKQLYEEGIWWRNGGGRAPPRSSKDCGLEYLRQASMLSGLASSSRWPALAVYSVALRDVCSVQRQSLLLRWMAKGPTGDRSRISQHSTGKFSRSNAYLDWYPKRQRYSGGRQASIWLLHPQRM